MRAYVELQLEMRQKYLGELLTIEKLCIQLNVLQKGNTQLARLRDMHLKHIHPLIHRLRVTALTLLSHTADSSIEASFT